MRKKMMTFVAAAALTLFAAAPAMAGPGVGGGDGACVAAGVQTLGGKGAQAIVDFVYGDSQTLRLPLGRTALEGIKAKLAAVQRDIAANEAIGLNTQFDE